jgi:hypothetical protein
MAAVKRTSPRRIRHEVQGGAGMGVDAAGGPVIDPTKNVLDVVDAAVRRLDDILEIRAQLTDEKIMRMEREWIHLDRFGKLRAEYEAMLRQAESQRLDSIRQVDREDVNKTAAQNLAALQTLQTQTSTMAETLRTQVSNTATTLANQLAQQFAESNKRVSALELTSSEGRGKQAVADPQLERLALLVEKLAASQATGVGKTEGISSAWIFVVGAVGLVGTLLSIAAVLYAVLKP